MLFALPLEQVASQPPERAKQERSLMCSFPPQSIKDSLRGGPSDPGFQCPHDATTVSVLPDQHEGDLCEGGMTWPFARGRQMLRKEGAQVFLYNVNMRGGVDMPRYRWHGTEGLLHRLTAFHRVKLLLADGRLPFFACKIKVQGTRGQNGIVVLSCMQVIESSDCTSA